MTLTGDYCVTRDTDYRLRHGRRFGAPLRLATAYAISSEYDRTESRPGFKRRPTTFRYGICLPIPSQSLNDRFQRGTVIANRWARPWIGGSSQSMNRPSICSFLPTMGIVQLLRFSPFLAASASFSLNYQKQILPK